MSRNPPFGVVLGRRLSGVPGLATVWTDYGRPAYDALRAAVLACKRTDPLAPVTILVPGNLTGMFVRRALAHGFGARTGVVALEVLTADRIADRIAAPGLIGSGRRPVTEPVLAAAWRRVLAADPGAFAPVAAHPATVRALVRAHRELREVDDQGLDAIAASGPIPADLVRLHRRVVALLHADWYDVVDLRRVAASASPGLGTVIDFLPQDPPAGVQALLDSLPSLTTIAGIERTGRPTTVLHASDADDEVRCVVRRLAVALRSTPAHRIAVLHGARQPYARLLADHLRAAGIRWNGAGVQPTIERTLARLLPAVLATHQTSWSRADVMRLLADAPAVTSSTRWERISRAAGVVGGDDWEVRLKAYAAEHRNRRARDADSADELRSFVTGLQERLREGESLTTWPALTDWARNTYATLTGDLQEQRRVPEDEYRANGAVLRTLDSLSGLEVVEPSADLNLLALTLDLALADDLPRHGRMGDGVLVAPVSAAIGLDADVVFVLGLSEDLVPGQPGTDALLPDELRELTDGLLPRTRDRIERRRRHVWAAFAAAPDVTASYSRGDLRRSTARRPSRWLLDQQAEESRSFADSLLGTAETASEHEWRTRAAAAHVLGQDHVLDLGVHLRRQRESPLLTRFDGDLSGHHLPDPADGSVLSPTSLEAWSRCPHGYFVEKMLRIRPIETPEEQLTISPIERGNLYHDTLDRFFIEQETAGSVPGASTRWTDAQRADLRRIAVEVADDLAVRGATGHRLLWAQELAGVLKRLDQFLDTDEAVRAATGRRQVRSELSFGLHGEPPLPVPLPDGRTLLLKGSADRIDAGPSGVVVVDYKSGSPTPFKGLGPDNPTLGGAKLQLPVYGYAARRALGEQEVSAEYWFVHGDAGRRVELPLTPAVEDAFLAALTTITDGLAGGLFPHRPPQDDGRGGRVTCAYCDPDGLGAGEHRDRWERKRTDPRLAAYVALVEPS